MVYGVTICCRADRALSLRSLRFCRRSRRFCRVVTTVALPPSPPSIVSSTPEEVDVT